MIGAAPGLCDRDGGINADGGMIGDGQAARSFMVYHHSRKAMVDLIAAFGKKQWSMVVNGSDPLHSDEKSGGINAANSRAIPFDMDGTNGLTTDGGLIVNGDRNRTGHRRLHIRAVKKDAMPRARCINICRKTVERQEHPFILIDWSGKRGFFEYLPQVNSHPQLSCLCATDATTASQPIGINPPHDSIADGACQRR